jgi:hypothetical protein
VIGEAEGNRLRRGQGPLDRETAVRPDVDHQRGAKQRRPLPAARARAVAGGRLIVIESELRGAFGWRVVESRTSRPALLDENRGARENTSRRLAKLPTLLATTWLDKQHDLSRERRGESEMPTQNGGERAVNDESDHRRLGGQRAAATRKRRQAGRKAAKTRKRRASARKAAKTRKHRASARKAVATLKRRKAAIRRKRRAAARKAFVTRLKRRASAK